MPGRMLTLPPSLSALWVPSDKAKELLGVSHTTLYRLVREGEVKHAKYQGHAIFGKKSIERYLSTWTREEKRLLALGAK